MKIIYALLLCAFVSVVGQAFAQLDRSAILSDVRAFEVSACKPSKNSLVTVWMEKRPSRKDNSEEAADMQVAYRASENNGRTWSAKGIIDLPNTFGTGNPFVCNNQKGDTYVVCMHIGQDFFSGNISLYEFDFDTKVFNLKSVPIKSSDNLLDKPSIVCHGDEIHLVYVAYTKNFKNAVKYQVSKDKGATWTEPINVFTDQTITYLGPAMALVKGNQLLISAGSYGSKGIFLTRRIADDEKVRFDTAKVVGSISQKLGSAMTELTTRGNDLLLSWQNPHQRNEVWLSMSRNAGESWYSPHLITSTGNLLSTAFGNDGGIHCIYSDFSDQKFSVNYRALNDNYSLAKEMYLAKPIVSNTFKEYLGAYQKILVQNKELFAFWIDYPDNSTLRFTKWKL